MMKHFIIFLSLLLVFHANVFGQQCTLCFDGSPVALPDKVVFVPGFDFEDTCSSVERLVKVLPLGDMCESIRSISSICGCPSPVSSPCRLCWDGSPVLTTDQQLPGFVAGDYIPSGPAVLFTCSFLQAYLYGKIHQNDNFCAVVQQDTGVVCGCNQSLPTYLPLAGYQPTTNHSLERYLDLDLRTILWQSSLPDLLRVYQQGGHARPLAIVRVNRVVADRTILVANTTSSSLVNNIFFYNSLTSVRVLDTMMDNNDMLLVLEYLVTDPPRQRRVGCRVGGLPPDEIFIHECLAPNGTLGDGDVDYSYDLLTGNHNGLTLASLSTGLGVLSNPVYKEYTDYYGRVDYGDAFVRAAMDVAAAQTGVLVLNVWMGVVARMEPDSWDAAVALYTGSLLNQDGVMLYHTVNQLGVTFGTCDSSDQSRVNTAVMRLFALGQDMINNEAVLGVIRNKIVNLMKVPLIQGTLYHVYQAGLGGTASRKARGTATAFVASVLPLVHRCRPEDAMGLDEFETAKKNLESNYGCMSVSCRSVGGLLATPNTYIPGAQPCTVSYPRLAGYTPTSQVDDKAAIDLDQLVFQKLLSNYSFPEALQVYQQGGFSQPYSDIVLERPLERSIPAGTLLEGLDGGEGRLVRGTIRTSESVGSTTLSILYRSYNDETRYMGSCAVGGLPPANQTTGGCLAPTGAVVMDTPFTSFGYLRVVANRNQLSLSRLSNAFSLSSVMIANQFYQYYGVWDYANHWVMSALGGVSTNFANGNANFAGTDSATRAEAAQRGSVVLGVWMRVLEDLDRAVSTCQTACPACLDDAVAFWDAAVAFYTGSLAGEGTLIYALSNDQCRRFGTCQGNARVLELFQQGQKELMLGLCDFSRETVQTMERLLIVPLVQGTLTSAHRLAADPSLVGEAATFAASILPIVHACNPADAHMIHANLGIGAARVNVVDVKAALERNYPCMGISCDDVGNTSLGACVDRKFERIGISYTPKTRVAGQATLDLDQQAFVVELSKGDPNDGFSAARLIYERGGFALPVADISLTSPVARDLQPGTHVRGRNARGNFVEGITMEAIPAGERVVSVQYHRAAPLLECVIGGLPSALRQERGCLDATGTVVIGGGLGPTRYTYNPTADNTNAQTLRSLGLTTESLCVSMDCPAFRKFVDYYGTFAYADGLVRAALLGNVTANSGFSSAGFRVSFASKATVVLHVWMYVIARLEEAVTTCHQGNSTSVHAWDVAVAVYTGSRIGRQEEGHLLYTLADDLCRAFHVCNSMAQTNLYLFDEFRKGQVALWRGACSDAQTAQNRVRDRMVVPLVQGVLFYAYHKNDEGAFAAFLASVLPLVHACRPSDARRLRNETSFETIKSILQRHYSCLGVASCADVGGLWDARHNQYFPNTEPCRDME